MSLLVGLVTTFLTPTLTVNVAKRLNSKNQSHPGFSAMTMPEKNLLRFVALF